MKLNDILAVRLASLTLLFSAATPAFAQEWTISVTSAPNLRWNSIAMSADGTVIAADSSIGVYVSTNSGATWILSLLYLSDETGCVACSADGSKLVATDADGDGIWRSMDFGATWSFTIGPSNFIPLSITTSADGTKLAAWAPNDTLTGAAVIVSDDSGATWAMTTETDDDGGTSGRIISSADGSQLILDSCSIYRSFDFGGTWALLPGQWSSSTTFPLLAASADGRRLVVGGDFQFRNFSQPDIWSLFTSVDSGATWNQTSSLTNTVDVSNYQPLWQALASSADGTKLAAAGGAVFGDVWGVISFVPEVYTSTNSGASWTTLTPPFNFPISGCTTIASSADGNILFAAANAAAELKSGGNSPFRGPIYRLQYTATPTLGITPSGTNSLLSWLVPSMPFTLQQSADLITWTDVPTLPALNYTNLHNEVNLPPPASGIMFYRLKH